MSGWNNMSMTECIQSDCKEVENKLTSSINLECYSLLTHQCGILSLMLSDNAFCLGEHRFRQCTNWYHHKPGYDLRPPSYMWSQMWFLGLYLGLEKAFILPNFWMNLSPDSVLLVSVQSLKSAFLFSLNGFTQACLLCWIDQRFPVDQTLCVVSGMWRVVPLLFYW